MPSIKLLQYNMDAMQRGIDYLRTAAKDADVFLLQRVPMEAKKEIENVLDCRLFLLESTPGRRQFMCCNGKKIILVIHFQR